jgi:hypothetical protein
MTTLKLSVVSKQPSADQSVSPIEGAMVLLAYSNGTYLTAITDTTGECEFELYRTDDQMNLLVAAEGHRACHRRRVPADSLFKSRGMVELEPGKERSNSILFTKSIGYIPGIYGRLNPINHNGTYLYADNIAINGRLARPAHFNVGECLDLIDVHGMQTTIRFLELGPQFSLLEYTTPKPYGAKSNDD